MKKICIVILAVLFITGCVGFPRTDAMSDLQKSKASYKECLANNPNDSAKCEALKQLFEVDRDTVESMGNQKPKPIVLLNR
jgi:hypothetical protein